MQRIDLVRTQIDEAAKQMDGTIESLQNLVATAATDPVPVCAKFVADRKSLDSQVEDLRGRRSLLPPPICVNA